ncbi:hypothetical protein QLS31_10005 [Flavobacterium sp. XS2P24]|uniref:hypothetical protein n=1 Tax=Flavobacterium sp. XS2P24 TaxID=3041249 RepID=UPI0024A7E461|nr:hypothetical protein [Flavobacterium sp. XS2P24]MDI6050162.1 hypothetical protein [Flavobacterium sp. XS2P24]
MENKEQILYKYLDIIIIESEIAEQNNSMNILNEKYLDSSIESEKFFRITDGAVTLGAKLGYLKYISKEPDWFELTEKGILAKSKGGYFKYLEFIEKKELERIKPTIIAENYIAGNNHGIQSSKSNFIKPVIQNANKITKTKPPKKSSPLRKVFF